MAVPRCKTSKSKTGQRRAHKALRPGQGSTCPRCNAQKIPHRICGNCGHYKGEKKLDIEGV